MGRDLRDLLKHDRGDDLKMKEGHEERFIQKLEKVEKKPANKGLHWWAIAAGLVVMIGLGLVLSGPENQSTIPQDTVVKQQETPVSVQSISLGDLSPDLEKLENFYLASINLELAELEISPRNQAVVTDYMERLTTLNEAYKQLQEELNELGPNDQTIEALIHNLQMRLNLLYRLKDKINNLKSSENETVTSHSI